MDHAERRVADLLLYGAHADRDGACVDVLEAAVPTPGLSVEPLKALPRRLVIVAERVDIGTRFAKFLRLRASEIQVLTSPDGMRGMHQPVFYWHGDPRHPADVRSLLAETARGLDLTDQPDALALVVAHLIGLRR